MTVNCVLIALISQAGNVLLQLRDDKQSIRFPGHWALPGGAVGNGETIIDAVCREFREEITRAEAIFDAKKLHYCGCTENPWGSWEYVFTLQTTIDELEITCKEGQGGRFFSLMHLPEQLPLHHLRAINLIKKINSRGVTAEFNTMNIFQEASVMDSNNVRHFIQFAKLGTTKDPSALEKGYGYRVQKEGAWTVLYHNGDPMRFLAYIEFGPGKTRGDHYHKTKVENMCVLSGRIRAQYKLPSSPDDILETILEPGDIVSILPGCAHSYISDDGALAVEFSPQLFERSDTIDIDFQW